MTVSEEWTKRRKNIMATKFNEKNNQGSLSAFRCRLGANVIMHHECSMRAGQKRQDQRWQLTLWCAIHKFWISVVTADSNQSWNWKRIIVKQSRLFFYYRPTGHDLAWDRLEHLHKFPAIPIIVTRQAEIAKKKRSKNLLSLLLLLQ